VIFSRFPKRRRIEHGKVSSPWGLQKHDENHLISVAELGGDIYCVLRNSMDDLS
jgi:hypothetical protein